MLLEFLKFYLIGGMIAVVFFIIFVTFNKDIFIEKEFDQIDINVLVCLVFLFSWAYVVSDLFTLINKKILKRKYITKEKEIEETKDFVETIRILIKL